ncbi:SEL1-like repeat protein [Sulfurovum sp.]|jgi:TPR repeat protein|uniref:SEL1-like repeat protein n=1 Tax=Sulfurovum sp. TaxID=1969726 RepID=UPI0025E88325|nr:SEL1-like repeat protein [Sulfurovum sp.]
MESTDNIELYAIVILLLFTIWFIFNTIKYYRGEKRKIKNLHRFAKEGEVKAQQHLARHYQKGDMVKKNCEKAAFWYQKAAFSGDDEAKGHLQKFLDNHKNKC